MNCGGPTSKRKWDSKPRHILLYADVCVLPTLLLQYEKMVCTSLQPHSVSGERNTCVSSLVLSLSDLNNLLLLIEVAHHVYFHGFHPIHTFRVNAAFKFIAYSAPVQLHSFTLY